MSDRPQDIGDLPNTTAFLEILGSEVPFIIAIQRQVILYIPSSRQDRDVVQSLFGKILVVCVCDWVGTLSHDVEHCYCCLWHDRYGSEKKGLRILRVTEEWSFWIVYIPQFS